MSARRSVRLALRLGAMAGVAGILAGCTPVRSEHDSCSALTAAVEQAADRVRTAFDSYDTDTAATAQGLEEAQKAFDADTANMSPVSVVAAGTRLSAALGSLRDVVEHSPAAELDAAIEAFTTAATESVQPCAGK